MQAIFMVGEQRSGSNLLRLILNESPDIAAPHPPHILQRMMPLLPFYGNLKKVKAFSKLVDDVCKLIELNPVPWDKVKLDRKEVARRCNVNSLIAVYGAVMDIYAETHKASSWLCKSMQNIRWADELNLYFDNPKYIYLYRDPRDVALSFKKAVIGDKHPYFIAQQWLELQELCIAQMTWHGNKTIFSINYEELVESPEETIKQLCQFLEIKFTKKMLNFHKSKDAKQSAESSSLWENLTQPINQNNSNKFLKELTSEEIQIIETITGDVMDELGYERTLINNGKNLKFSNEDIERFAHENAIAINKMSAQITPEDLKRRNLQSSVIEQIKATAQA